jgi:hypothetical protein
VSIGELDWDSITETSAVRGHIVVVREGEDDVWRYADTGELFSCGEQRACIRCGKAGTVDGHDECIGSLPGVVNACCGHGNVDYAYVHYQSGLVMRGHAAVLEHRRLRMRAGNDQA